MRGNATGRRTGAVLMTAAVLVGAGWASAPASAEPKRLCGYVVTSSIGLNLRAAASRTSAVLATMPHGTRFVASDVTVSNEGILWRQSSYQDRSGWADNSGMRIYTC
jgi:hypothetical protein